MTLTNPQILSAYAKITSELLSQGPVAFDKPGIKQAIQDAEAWAETPSVKSDFNSSLTAGDFKTNATPDQKRLVLIFALLSIVQS